MLQILESNSTTQVDLNDAQLSCLAELASQIDRLNETMRTAVDAGMSIELRRASRHHQGSGFWGDIIAPNVVRKA